VGKHWRPEGKIVRIRPVRRGAWTRPSDYGDFDVAAPRRVVPVVLGAVLLGFVAAGVISWTGKSVKSTQPDDPIEWNVVQAVPKRALSPDEIAWERRGEELDSAPTSSGQEVQVVRGSGEPADAGSPSVASARKDDIFVIDGDTFSMGGQRIRIAGIDAPETRPPRCMEEARLGLAATQKLRELLASGTVTVSGTTHDKYGRDVREVRVNGQDVGEAMISAGVAREYGSGRRPWC
jgi:micrococcal nuclease